MNLKDLLKDAYKEGMTAEEIESALESAALPEDRTGEIERLTQALSKSNGEAAEYKRQLRAKMTEDEQKKQKEQEERAELENRYKELLRETAIAKNKAKYISLGYDEDLAEETAKAITDGDAEKALENQKKHLDAFEKRIRAEALKNTPKPTPDGAGKTITVEQLRKMSPQDRFAYATAHPEEYKEIYGGN